jgi:hypothetical protein
MKIHRKFYHWWINAGKVISAWVIVAMILGFIYPWIAKAVQYVLPAIEKYYEWVSKL